MPKLSSAQDKRKLTMYEIADAWAFWTIRIWGEKIQKYKVGKTGHLEHCFSKSISGTSEGENIVIEILFLYYGRFVDMGVGKGVPISEVGAQKASRMLQGKMTGNRRYPKKWYSKTLFAETATLKEILAREYAHKGAIRVTEGLGSNVTIL